MKNTLLLFLAFTIFFSCDSSKGTKEKDKPNGQRPSATQIISELDGNGDGRISKNEANGPIANDFSKLDKNNDGFLTLEELNSAAKKPGKNSRKQPNADLTTEIDASVKGIPVNVDYFIAENIIGGIQKKVVDLSGVKTDCYVLKTRSQATEHKMGPWCPRHIEDGMEKAGIWFEDNKVYDVSGHFISKLDEFYSDDKWRLYREDGSIKVTDTKEACLAAAKPNVEEEYHNHCVECMPEYFKDQVTTFVIPVTPIFLKTAQDLGRGA